MEVQTFQGIGYECNSYLIKDRTWILVDVGTDQNAEKLVRSITKEGGLEKVEKIVLTHTHFDHAGCAARMSELTGAELLVHPLEGKRISSGDFTVTLTPLFGGKMRPFPWSPIDEGFLIDSGSSEFRVLHLPGHSEGSIGLWEETSGSLIVGDTIFSDGGIGRYDLPSSSFDQLKKSIGRISKLNMKNLYPGHGRIVLGDGAKHVAMSFESVRSGI